MLNQTWSALPLTGCHGVVLELCHGSAIVPSAVSLNCAKALGKAVARLQDSANSELSFLLLKGL